MGGVSFADVASGFSLADQYSRVRYVVRNGFCYVEVWGLVNTYSDSVQRECVLNLPKAKLSSSVFLFNNIIYVWENDTRLILQCQQAATLYTSLVYPIMET